MSDILLTSEFAAEVAQKVAALQATPSTVEVMLFEVFPMTKADIILMQLCPVLAVTGALAAFIVKQKFPGSYRIALQWSIRGIVLASVTGALVAIFFMGMATNGQWTLLRILALSFFLGANAIEVWKAALNMALGFLKKAEGATRE